jgi:hypothetical protein
VQRKGLATDSLLRTAEPVAATADQGLGGQHVSRTGTCNGAGRGCKGLQQQLTGSGICRVRHSQRSSPSYHHHVTSHVCCQLVSHVSRCKDAHPSISTPQIVAPATHKAHCLPHPANTTHRCVCAFPACLLPCTCPLLQASRAYA